MVMSDEELRRKYPALFDKEPSSDWEIPMLYRRCRYDVGLENDSHVVFWSMDVDLVKVTEAVTELLIMKEKEADAFKGNIVIRPSADVSRSDRPDYNGGQCEEDSDDGGGRRHGHLQSVGRDQSSSSGTGDSSGKVRPSDDDHAKARGWER